MKTKKIYQALVLITTFVLSGVIFPITAFGTVEGPSCGFSEKEGRTIVKFKKGEAGNTKVYSNKTEAKAMMQAPASIPAGVYDITLVSYDWRKSTSNTESNESWFVILNNGENEVTRTSATADLEDGAMSAGSIDLVETGFTIPSDIDSVVAYHAAYKDTSSSNSVKPVCAVFDKVEQAEPEPVEPITIIASKVVCENEEDLPNWGEGGADITISTAADWVSQENSCSFAPGWSFQWGYGGAVSNPGNDFYGEAQGNWNTFGPTNEDGVASVEIDDIENVSKIWVREVLQDGYIPFSYTNTDDNNDNDVSAEMYCASDVLNYDNYDYISNPQPGNDYYCVAFNSPIKTPNTKPVITLTSTTTTITVGDTFDPLSGFAMANDAEDGDITSNITASSTVSTTTPGTYQVDYDVVDSGGLAADTKTMEVVVVELPKECTDTIMARIIISDVQNWEGANMATVANMTNNIYLGSTTTVVASGEWFPLYENGAYINDPDMTSAGYEDVPGLAVERREGSVRVLLHGSHPKTKKQTKEHVSGTIEFSGVELAGFRSDNSGNNKLENGFNGEKTYSAGNDEVWSGNKNNFWMTVTTADDGFFADYTEPELCTYDNNQRPVITLLGDESIFITAGDTFNDPGVMASDAEDGDITSKVVVGGMTVDTNTVGAYVIRYNVSDSEGLAASEVMRLVIVEAPQTPNTKPVITLTSTTTTITVGDTFDPLSGFAMANDAEDGDITSNITASSTVSTTTPGTYQVDYDVVDSGGLAADTKTMEVVVVEREDENSKPVIVLLGDSTITITEGDAFTDPGATANDAEDGDITDDIIVGGDSVDTANAGTYTITYNVSDSEGLAADEITRTVIVKKKEIVTPACTNCGGGGNGGGGGGPIMPSLRIFNEKLELLSNGAVVFSWETDKPATSRVVYDDISHKTTTYAINIGYASSTEEVSTPVKKHTMMITGLQPNTQYFFRPISTAGNNLTKIGNEKTFALPTVEEGESLGECSYLKDYLRMGDNNDVEEVKKLQQFLKDFEGFSDLEVSGIFDQATFDAVSLFQSKYRSDILDPWGIEVPTGYVYYTTQKKINEIQCKKAFPLTQNQQAEISSFNALLNELQTEGRQGEVDLNTIGRVGGVETGSAGLGEDSGLAALTEGGPVDSRGDQNGQTASILGSVSSGNSGGTTTESVAKKGMFASVFGALKNGFGIVVDSVKRFFVGNSTNEDEILEDTTATTTEKDIE